MRRRPWYSIACPACGRDTTGSVSGSPGTRLSANQIKFICPHCKRYIDLRKYSVQRVA